MTTSLQNNQLSNRKQVSQISTQVVRSLAYLLIDTTSYCVLQSLSEKKSKRRHAATETGRSYRRPGLASDPIRVNSKIRHRHFFLRYLIRRIRRADQPLVHFAKARKRTVKAPILGTFGCSLAAATMPFLFRAVGLLRDSGDIFL